MESNIIKDFNLPSYIKGKSFAGASEAINKKFEGREDNASRATKDDLLKRLAEAQEFIKMKDGVANNTNQAAFGELFAKSGEALGNASAGNMLGGASSLINAGQDLFGKPNVDMSGDAFIEKENGALNALTSGADLAMKGAQVGGPVGAIVGGAIGVGSGIIGANKHNKAADRANHNYVTKQSQQYRESDFAYGGKMTNDYNLGGPFETGEIEYDTPESAPDLKLALNSKDNFGDKVLKGLDKGINYLGENAGKIMSLAPIAQNIMATKNLKPTTTERGARLDNVYQPKYLDEGRYLNQIDQRNTSRALQEMSGGDTGAAMSNLLGLHAKNLKAKSDVMSAADEVNRGEDRFAFQTGLQKDMTNVNLEQDFINRKAQDSAAFESTKQALKGATAENIGALGKEMVDKKLVKEMFGYTWDGKYYVDGEGNKFSSKDVFTKIKSLFVKDKEKVESNMYGGYLKK